MDVCRVYIRWPFCIQCVVKGLLVRMLSRRYWAHRWILWAPENSVSLASRRISYVSPILSTTTASRTCTPHGWHQWDRWCLYPLSGSPWLSIPWLITTSILDPFAYLFIFIHRVCIGENPHHHPFIRLFEMFFERSIHFVHLFSPDSVVNFPSALRRNQTANVIIQLASHSPVTKKKVLFPSPEFSPVNLHHC